MQTWLLDRTAASPFSGLRVLVTGASGFLGSQTIRQGLAAGVEIHALGRTPGPIGSRFHRADLTDRVATVAAVAAARPHGVIHCAAPPMAATDLTPDSLAELTVGGTEALLDACRALPNPPAVVVVGSGFEYAPRDVPIAEDWPTRPSLNPYGAAQAAALPAIERFARQSAITLLRPFHIYGAGEPARRLAPHLIALSRGGGRVALTAGAQRRDFIHVDDCAACLWTALARQNPEAGLELFNIGSGVPITIRHYITLLLAELTKWGHSLEPDFGAIPYRAGEPAVSLPDISRWRTTTGWQPGVDLATGVADQVAQELARCD